MSSLPFVFGTPAAGRVFKTNATKSGSAPKEEKSFVDWLLGKITKEDQFYETDPILNGGERKSGGTTSGRTGGTTSGKKGTTSAKKGTVSIPSKKNNNGNGGLGGLFFKKK